MTSNDYCRQVYEFPLDNMMLRCFCKCTGGETNDIEVVLENYVRQGVHNW